MSNKPAFNPIYSHIGICVSDIERSKLFYKNALGFSDGAVYEADENISDLLGFESSAAITSQMMMLGNLVIELIYFKKPEAFSGGPIRPMNQLGLTHLSFTVDDIDSAAAHLESCGAKILPDTRTVVDFSGADPSLLIFCTDPDGTRIELYKPSSNWSSL